VWDLQARRLDRILPPCDGTDPRCWVTFSPDGRRLVTTATSEAHSGCYRFRVGTWERETVAETPGVVETAAPLFSPDGRLLAFSVSPRRVRLADPNTGRALAHLSTLDPVHPVPRSFTPDGTRLAVTTADGLVHIWDLRRVREQLTELNLDWESPPY